jgi:hypothetical protein
MATVSDDERGRLVQVIHTNRTWTKRMSDGHLSTGSASDEEIADAILAAGFRLPQPVTDATRKMLADASLWPWSDGDQPQATMLIDALRTVLEKSE